MRPTGRTLAIPDLNYSNFWPHASWESLLYSGFAVKVFSRHIHAISWGSINLKKKTVLVICSHTTVIMSKIPRKECN